MADPLPAEADTEFLCLSGRGMTIVLGVFSTKEKAEAWRDSANVWYGADHPLHPVRVEPVKKDVRPFPVDAMKKMGEAKTEAERNAAMREMFSTLDDDYDDQGKAGDRR